MSFNMLDMMKQVQGLQERAVALKDELEKQSVTGESAAGLVRVVLKLDGQCEALTIDPSLIQNGNLDASEGKQLFEDLIQTAYNDATQKAREKKKEAMSGLLGGLPLGLETLL